MLNDSQKKAVEHTGAPLLIIAGAGTGKTTVITEKIAYLVAQGLAKPEEILALTFTEKAAREMHERVEAALTGSYSELSISTFHSFTDKLLREFGVFIGLSTQYSQLDETQAWHLVYRHFERFTFDILRPRGTPGALIHSLLTHVSRLKDEAVSTEDYLAFAEGRQLDTDTEELRSEAQTQAELANFYHEYQRLLLEEHALDFADLVMYAYELLNKRPAVRSEIQKRYKYILVDEFQDTNVVQYAVVRLLAGDGTRLTVVADDDQSIYKFRGASVSNVLQFTKDFAHFERVALVDNYRSGQVILDAAYHLITNNNPDRLEVQLPNLSKKLISHTDEPGTVSVRSFARGMDEAAWIVQTCEALHSSGVSWDEMAVLARSKATALPFVTALERAGIPVVFNARAGLLRERIVLDILAILKMVTAPHDNVAVHRVLCMEAVNMPQADYAMLIALREQSKQSFFELLKTLGEGKLSPEGGIARAMILKGYETLAFEARRVKTTTIVTMILADFHLIDAIALGAAREDDVSVREMARIRSFLEFIATFESRAHEGTAVEFLDFVQLMVDSGDEGSFDEDTVSGIDAVQVMTVHASKGLEFDHVFIPSMVAGRFPVHARGETFPLPTALIKEIGGEKDAHLQEERRLMYVALTRARTGLYVSFASNYGGKQNKKPSMFVPELEVGIEPTEAEVEVARFTVTPVTAPTTLPRPTTFSFTGIAAYDQCPLQYKFREVLKIPVKGKGHLSFGTSLHSTLEAFYKRALELSRASQQSMFETIASATVVPSLEELLALYDEHWIDAWYNSRLEHDRKKDLGRAMLRDFYKLHEGTWTLPLFLEKKFTLKLGAYTVIGKIDRIDPFVDGVRIIDYKTGKPKTDQKIDSETKAQLFMYQLAAEEGLGLSVRQLTYYYLEDQGEVSFIGGEKELAKLRETLPAQLEAIHDSTFEPTPSSWTCSSCDYRDYCEFREL